jgi:hypothetical protein
MSDFDGDNEPRSRAPIAIAVAVVLLAVLGGSVGFIVATANRAENNAHKSGQGGPSSAAVTPTTQAASPSGRSTRGSSQPTSTRSAKSYPPATGNDCPQQSDDAAGVGLTLVQYLRTARSEVWICKDGGKLYYQGHVRGQDFTAATTECCSIFLTDVVQQGGAYRATNVDTIYIVEPNRLRIQKNGAQVADEPAVGS